MAFVTESLLLGIAVVAAYVLASVAYRLFFHPVAKYPGPLLAKLTNARGAYHAWRGDIHLDIARCHEKYGPFVRYGPNRVLVNSPAGFKDIYGLSAKKIRKSTAYNALVHRTPSIFTLREKREHAWRRRILTQGFSDAGMRAMEPVILEEITNLEKCMIENEVRGNSSLWTSPKNMSDWSSYLSFDIMSRVIFGQYYNLLGSDEHRAVIKDLERNNFRTAVFYNEISLKPLKVEKWLFPDSIEGRNGVLKYIGLFLRREGTSKEGEGQKHLFSLLQNAADPETGRKLNDAQLRAETATLIVAGMDTTSTALAATFFYLVHFPEAQARLAAEVRNAFPTAEDIRLGSKLSSCKFLYACINESMRMSPSAGGPLWREVEAGGATVDGNLFNAGSEIGTGIYAIHRNPEAFPDPYRFDPDRWFHEGAAERAAFAPFSIGSRGCVGKPLSMAELPLVVAQVAWRYEFRLADGELGRVGAGSRSMGPGREREHEFQLFDRINAAKDGPYVVFRHRQHGP